MTTNELVAQQLNDVDPGYYQDQEEGCTVIPPGPGVARFYKTNSRIRFDGISQLSMVGHLRQWPPTEGEDDIQATHTSGTGHIASAVSHQPGQDHALLITGQLEPT